VATVAIDAAGGTVSAGGASTGGCSPTGLVPGDSVETAGRDGVVAGGEALTPSGCVGTGLCLDAGAEDGSGAVGGGLVGRVLRGGAQHWQQCR
jgi:hypothetical protein